MASGSRPAAGALAGARAWAGSEHELAVAAVLAAHVLAEQPVRWLDLPDADAVPLDVRLQVDRPVDDIAVALSGGGQALVQARRTLTGRTTGPTSLAAVVVQWAAEDAARPLDPAHDRVVGVAERLSGLAVVAAEELARSRLHDPGAATDRQEQAIAAVVSAIGRPADVVRVLACGVLHRLDALAEHGPDRLGAERLLEARVVAEGQGRRAWQALHVELAALARRRAGLDRRRLLQIVAQVCDLRVPRVGSRAAADHSEFEHRRRVAAGAEILTFAGLRAGVPALDRGKADAGVRAVEGASPLVEPSTEDIRRGIEPAVLARRHGRVLLCGLPGAGKSTALLDIAADMASDPDGPLPLIVSARALLGALAHPARAALLERAVDDAPIAEVAGLRTAADAALVDGRAAILVDGLDECDDPHAVLRAILDVLRDAHGAVETVVATRNSLLADAATITGWPAVQLVPPLWPSVLARQVLAVAAATNNQVGNTDDWVKVRLAWVEDRLEEAPELGRTPLLVVLISHLRAGREDDTLPHAPAAVLRDALATLVDAWESAKPDDRIEVSGLAGAQARAALELAMRVIGSAVLTGCDAYDDLRNHLASRIASELDLRPLVAHAAATSALAFWDRCGVFVLDAARQRVVPRARQLAELAQALDVLERPVDHVRAWASAVALDASSADVLRLTAGLSAEAREAATLAAADEGLPATILRVAQLAGPCELSERAARRLGEAAALAAREDDDQARALDLAVVAVDLATTPDVAALVENWPQTGQRAMLLARAALRAGSADYGALRALVARRDIERVAENDVWAQLMPELHFSATFVEAAARLVDLEPSLGPHLVGRLRDLTITDAERLGKVLERHGHGALVRSALAGDATADQTARVDHERLMTAMHAANRTIIDWISQLAAPAALDQRGRRGLEQLAGLWSGLRIARAPAFEPAGVLEHRPELARKIVDLAARLFGADLGVLAAQAAEVIDAWQDDAPPMPMDVVQVTEHKVPALDAWTDVEKPETAQDLLIDAMAVGRWLPETAFAMLATAPVGPDRVAELHRRLPTLPAARQRFRLATLLCWWQRSTALLDDLLDDEDPATRRGAVRWLVFLASISDEKDRVAHGADDPDDGVRTAMLQNMATHPLRESSGQALRAADWSPRPWRCLWCEHDNPAGCDSCEHCRVVDGDARRALATLTARL